MKAVNLFKIILAAALFLVFLDNIGDYFLIGNNKQDARVINYTGLVRGMTQRLVKLEVTRHYDEAEALSSNLDGLILGLTEGSVALGLDKATDSSYLNEMEKVSAEWATLKKIIFSAKDDPDRVESLVSESEKYFLITDDAVLAAQKFSEKKIEIAEDLQLVFIILEMSVLIILGFFISKKVKNEDVLVDELVQFKAAAEGIAEHVFFVNLNGLVVYANKAVEQITGYTMNEVIGQEVSGLWGKHMGADFYEKLWNTIKVEKKVFTGIVKNQRKNGEFYDAIINISPIFDMHGEPKFFVGLERDTTKDVALDKAKTEFVSLASHQLRTPLTAVSWYTELLLNGDAGKLTKKQDDYLKEVARGNRRMIDLVNSLLDVSRMELGTFIINPELSDVCKLMEETIKELKPVVDKSKVDMEYTCGKNIPKLLLDTKLTRFIFQNLLTNSLKYSREGGIVRADIILKENDVLISVADNGLGIPKRQQGEIFKKFFRADNVRVMDTEGTGLGLYLVKMLADSMGGKVWFDSEENVGSTFYISIPLTGEKGRKGEKSIIKV